MKKNFIVVLIFTNLFLCLNAQEALDSVEENYYNFLSLTGATERNYLNYRTLSDSSWNFQTAEISDSDEEILFNVWAGNNLGETKVLWELNSSNKNWFTKGLNTSFSYKIYGPQWYSSYNTQAPFGVNDGALWQGKGYNTAFTTGARIEAFGFELTIKPQVSFSQNLSFDYQKAENMTSSLYEGKASEYGYWWTVVDCVQRFGDSAFWNYDWGDTEARWNWYNFTVGFGTEAIWLGPAFYTSMLSTNNAATYPKFDIGFRKMSLYMPYFGWYLGDFESRIWVGKLSESDYFDNNDTNNHNQISGFTITYAPPFLKGFSLGMAKVTLNKWGENFWQYALPFFAGNTIKTSENNSGEDQKASIYADWLFEKVGLEIFGELAFDDFLVNGFTLYEYERYPFHALSYTVGMKKTVEVSKKKNLRGLIQFEWNSSEVSRDYELWYGSAYNYGTHGQITQGYTNKGQWLGSGYGYGGNNQILSFTLYSHHGYEKFFIQRNNPDNNYIWAKTVGADKATTQYYANRYYTAFKANFNIGIEEMWYILPKLSLRAAFIYNKIINPQYNPLLNDEGKYRTYNYINNFSINCTIKYQF